MTTNQPQTQRKFVRTEQHSVLWDLWVQDVLEFNPNPGKPRQVQRFQHDQISPKLVLSPQCSTNQDAKAQQNSGNITQSREIIAECRERSPAQGFSTAL